MAGWTIRRRLRTRLVASFAVLWMIGGLVAALEAQHELNELFDASLSETATQLLPLLIADLAESSPAAPPTPPGRHDYIAYQLRSAAGEVMLRSPHADAAAFPAPLKPGRHVDRGRRYHTKASTDGRYFLQLSEDTRERKEAIWALWFGMLAPLLAMAPVAAWIIDWTIRRATAPMLATQAELRARSGENLEPITVQDAPGELEPIITDANRLLGRLKAALQAERSFTANSAHELRNPLAAAKAQAELLIASLDGDDERRRGAGLIATLSQLARRIERILQMSRVDAGLGMSRETTDLISVTNILIRGYPAASRLKVVSAEQSPLVAAIDPDAYGIALQNLIDNALSHGPEDACVEIVIEAPAVVRVVSGGSMTPPAELEVLTDPYRRGSRTRAAGAGLGLAIVHSLLQQTGGRLELKSPATGRQEGFEARLEFARVS